MHSFNAPTARPMHAMRADALFQELDGRELRTGFSRWRASVLGIHMDGDDAWIQLSLVGPSNCSVVLHLLPTAAISGAIDALTSWLARAAPDRPRVVEA